MKRHLTFAGAALLLACAAYGRDGIKSETIRLRYIGPENVAETLKTRKGIDQLTLNYSDNSVTVRGDEQAINGFKTAIQSADVPAAVYWVRMHLVRYHVDAAGRHTETIVMSPTISTIQNMPASCTESMVDRDQNSSGYSVLVTVTPNADKTVSLSSEIRELGIDGEIVSSGKNVRNVRVGETVRTVGMTDAKDKVVRRAVHHGAAVNNLGEYTGYYLDVKIDLHSPSGK